MTGSSTWSDAADLARKVEGAGFSGMLYTETGQVRDAARCGRHGSSQPHLHHRHRRGVPPQPDGVGPDRLELAGETKAASDWGSAAR